MRASCPWWISQPRLWRGCLHELSVNSEDKAKDKAKLDTADVQDSEQDLREETAEAAPEVADHDRVGALEAEFAEAKSAVLYAQAETQNVRRRAEKEAADARTYAATGFARDILSVADNLARALAAIPAE